MERELRYLRAEIHGSSSATNSSPNIRPKVTLSSRVTPPETITPVPQPAKDNWQKPANLWASTNNTKTKIDNTSAPKAKIATPPTFFDQALSWLQQYFTEGNIIVRVGIVVMFFGLSFLAKYSVDNGLLPIEYRLCAITITALGLLIFGWYIRQDKPVYGLILQGGGIAALYLASFASYRLYELIPAGIAFPLLIVFSVVGMGLARAKIDPL